MGASPPTRSAKIITSSSRRACKPSSHSSRRRSGIPSPTAPTLTPALSSNATSPSAPVSAFLLAEILLSLDLEPDPPFATDHCGTCTRCIEACPTDCILPDRTLDARRCISYLTIENKGDIPEELRPLMQDWIFGCDLCQTACPWNRFAAPEGDASFQPSSGSPFPDLVHALALTPSTFNRQFKRSPIQRAKRRGLLRNAAVALGNISDERAIPALEKVCNDPEPIVQEHTKWAIEQIENRKSEIENLK
jgi:epoxyqueuosine reductase